MYRPVFNRSNHLNVQGKVLMQVETYLDKKKVFFYSHLFDAQTMEPEEI